MRISLKRITGWFVDDWVPFKSFDAIWYITTDFGEITETCGYQFVYSKYQDRTRLMCWGYKPKDHKMYKHVKQRYKEFLLKHKPMENTITTGGTTLVALKTRY